MRRLAWILAAAAVACSGEGAKGPPGGAGSGGEGFAGSGGSGGSGGAQGGSGGGTAGGSGGDTGGGGSGGDAGSGGSGGGGGSGGLPRFRGHTRDLFGGEVLASVEIALGGLQPPVSGTSDAAGAFDLAVPAGSTFTPDLRVAFHRPTRNRAVRVGGATVEQDAWAAAISDVNRQYALAGATPTDGRAVLLADLAGLDGKPLEGVPAADVTLTDAQGRPAGAGPYFVGAAGDLDSTLLVSAAHAGRARAVFLDVPPGTQTLHVARGTDVLDLELILSPGGVTLGSTADATVR